MIANEQGAMIVIDDVFLSVWRRPYTLEALDDVAALVAKHDPKADGRLTSLALYRFDRVYPNDFADPAVRRRMVELSRTCRYRLAINILDGPGLVNASIRFALSASLTMMKTPYPIKTVDSVSAGIACAREAGPDQGTLTTAMWALERKVWPPSVASES